MKCRLSIKHTGSVPSLASHPTSSFRPDFGQVLLGNQLAREDLPKENLSTLSSC